MVPIVVMGVAGCGKSTVGKALAERLQVPYGEADDFHPPANVAKMQAGEALTDSDRAPWLATIAEWIGTAGEQGRVVSCSALKRAYREYLTEQAREAILFVFLDGTQELIASRMAVRQHEYMPASLLASQFATLERPADDENALKVPITLTVDEIVERTVQAVPHLKSFKRKQ